MCAGKADAVFQTVFATVPTEKSGRKTLHILRTALALGQAVKSINKTIFRGNVLWKAGSSNLDLSS